jgi:CheY-like chemotaxis protein
MNVCHQNCPQDSSLEALRTAPPDKRIVLFVDDEPTILSTRRVIFEAQGYAVLTADSGAQALALLRERRVDAVVLDYQMPGMDGQETARRIRKAYGSSIRIISCSGSLSLPPSMPKIVDVSLEKGAGPLALINIVKSTTARTKLNC